MLDKQRYTNSDHLKKEQYNDAKRLSARIRLHTNYSTSKESVPSLIFDNMLAEIPDTANILEVGTGRGDLWAENAHRIPENWQMTLTDLSTGMIDDNKAHLGELSERMTYNVVNAINIPYPDNSFDAVLANYMLYHVPDREKTFSEIRRVLKPDGVLFAATNGNNHMKKIYVIAEYVDNETDWQSIAEKTFGLQNGTEQLMPYFTDIRMLNFVNNLWIPSAQPVLDYIESMVAIDGDAILQEIETEIRENLNQTIADKGGILIEKETGLFIARGNYEKRTSITD
ncbi:MAG: hypothetical protein Phog2KO_36300 [Phototrophicaceae bacterium]